MESLCVEGSRNYTPNHSQDFRRIVHGRGSWSWNSGQRAVRTGFRSPCIRYRQWMRDERAFEVITQGFWKQKMWLSQTTKFGSYQRTGSFDRAFCCRHDSTNGSASMWCAAQDGGFLFPPVPSIYSIVPPNDGSALRHGHHFEPVDFVIDHGRGHHDAYSAGSCQRTYARACECQ